MEEKRPWSVWDTEKRIAMGHEMQMGSRRTGWAVSMGMEVPLKSQKFGGEH